MKGITLELELVRFIQVQLALVLGFTNYGFISISQLNFLAVSLSPNFTKRSRAASQSPLDGIFYTDLSPA